MKKLMVMLVAAASAIAANAYSVDWEVAMGSFMMSDDSSYPNGQTMYVMNTSAAGWSDFAADLAAGKLGANLAAVIASDAFATYNIGTGTTYADTDPEMLAIFYGQVDTTQATVDANLTTYALALFTTDGDKYMLTTAVDGMSYDSDPGDGSPASFYDTEFAGGWATYSSVPEPTSGLLLLLGVAGLALKRKRA